MPTRVREYHRPPDWANALKLLRRPDIHTAPLVVGPKPPLEPNVEVEAVVDLSRLALAYVTQSDDETIHLGAMTPLQDLIDSPLLSSPANSLLPQATHHVAHYGLRNLATVGGAVLSPEGPPEILLALLAFDAIVVLRGDETREIALSDFLAADSAPGAVIAEVKFHRLLEKNVGGALERVARTPRDEAIVAAAAVLEVEKGVCRRARLSLAGIGPRPQRMMAVGKMLEGAALTADRLQATAEVVAAEAHPPSDYRGSAEYRRAMAGVLTKRALEEAWKKSEGTR